jgi:hypothetical protein
MKVIDLKVQRLPDDPLCLRISIGGNEKLGYYCVFRGDQKEVIETLKLVYAVFRKLPPVDIEDDISGIGKS